MLLSICLLAFKPLCTLALCVAGGKHCNDYPPADFFELQKYAHLASVAYCLEKGLSEGIVGTQGARCPSKACYHPETTNLDIVKTFQFTGLFEVGSGIIAIDDSSKTIYLAFMGTSTFQDWLNNLSAIPVSYRPLVVTSDEFKPVDDRNCENCRVHKGINSFLRLNGALVLKEVLRYKNEYPDYRLVVTGHSLGAALATFAGIELRLLGFDVLVVTLAGPKIGEKNFSKFVDDLFDTADVINTINEDKSFDHLKTGLIRMVHLHDLVPYLPPTSYFKHSGFEYYLAVEGLDQTPETIERRGTDYVEDESIEYRELIPGFRRLDHTSYFLPVSHCI